jgi:aldehyde dehydrogenase (NAD+)
LQNQRLEVINPATGAAFTTVARTSAAEIDPIVAAAKEAQLHWAKVPLAERRLYIERLADAIRDSAEDLSSTLVREQGKPLAEAKIEIGATEAFARYFAAVAIPIDVVQDDAEYRIEIHRKPLGVVVGITPWNFPVLISSNKLVPALLMGNSFILKPSPTTPVTLAKIVSLAATIFPKNLVQLVIDANDLGAALTGHPDVAKISFTGSTATGKKIMQNAASTLKRLTLELGGNDAAIVLGDVDIKSTAQKIFNSAFFNCGQVCIALKRAYVHSSIYDELCAELAKLAEAAKVGDGLDASTTIGPLQNAMQFDKAKHFLAVARKDGKIIAGGEAVDGPGYFVRPTIVRDIDDSSELVAIEQFAPILPIVRFDDLDDIIRRANDTPYGLGGSVWSGDVDKALAIAQRIESGTVWVNHHLHFGPHIPFGGAKESGIGVEFSLDGIKEFSQTTVISLAK